MQTIHCARCGEMIVRPPPGEDQRCSRCIAQEIAAAAYEADGRLTCIRCGMRKPLSDVDDVGPGYRCHVCTAELQRGGTEPTPESGS